MIPSRVGSGFRPFGPSSGLEPHMIRLQAGPDALSGPVLAFLAGCLPIIVAGGGQMSLWNRDGCPITAGRARAIMG